MTWSWGWWLLHVHCASQPLLRRISSLDPQTLLVYFLCVLFIPFIFTDEKLRHTEIRYLLKVTKQANGGTRIVSCLVWQEPESSQFPFLHLWAPRDGEAGWALWSLSLSQGPASSRQSTAMNWTVGYGVPSGTANPSIFHSASTSDVPKPGLTPLLTPISLSVKIDSLLFACLWNLHIWPTAILGSPSLYKTFVVLCK